MRSKYRHAIITTVLVILLLATISNSRSQTIGVIQLAFVLSTSSDWTKLTFYNLTLLSWNYHLISGQNASQLSYAITTTIIEINKRQYDETNVTIEIEGLVQPIGDQVKLLVEKGAIGETLLRINSKGKELAFISSTGSVPGHEDNNARLYDIAGVFNGLNLTELNLRRVLERPMVLAFYYPWYGNNLGKSGQQYHWSGISYQGIGSSTYNPLFGPYDSQDERLIDAHIELAKASGIDGFICSWWGIDTFEDTSFKQILKVANSEGFKVTIYYESVRDIGRDQIVNELSYVIGHYANETSFLKIDGRPVIFLYAVSAYNRDAEFWKGVVKRVRESTGIDPLYIADTFDVTYAEVFDGFHTYSPIWISEGELNNIYSDQAKAARVAGKIWAATVCPGYDDRKIRNPGTYISRKDGGYYNLTWESAIDSDPDIILICTWNEWHEGTNIEPSREFEFKYLQLTNYWTAAYKNATSQGLRYIEPMINESILSSDRTLKLTVKNNGDGAAFALNIMLRAQNLSDFHPSGIIYLSVNDTCICLFVPLLRSNETFLTNMSYDSNGMSFFTSDISYYSPNGKEFVSIPVTISSEGGGSLSGHDLLIISLSILSLLIAVAYFSIRLILRHDRKKNLDSLPSAKYAVIFT